jgi:carbamoyltransferase
MPKNYVLGVAGYDGSMSHDAAAALVEVGVLVHAVEEERCIRIKHAPGRSPVNASLECLAKRGIKLSDLCAIATSWNEESDDEVSLFKPNSRGTWVDTLFPCDVFPDVEIPKVYIVKHHRAHITAGYCLSGYDDAACICVDGQGECESITIAKASKAGIDILRKYDIVYSLGAFYEAASYFSGLGYNVPGKFMGLASYGHPRYSMPLSFDAKNGKFKQKLPDVSEEACSAEELCEAYVKYFISSQFPFMIGDSSTIMLYADFAASVQSAIDSIVVGLAQYAHQLTGGCDKLVLCGGVALNCITNDKVLRAGIFDSIYVPPGSNDASTAIGAAMEASRLESPGKEFSTLDMCTSASFGRLFSPESIYVACEEYGLFPVEMDSEQLCKTVAHDLADGKIIVWHQGRSEFGPRALGCRSLLADARIRENYVKMNVLKGREMWRPFAPSILDEHYEHYFSDSCSNLDQFMLRTALVKPSVIGKIPAIVHSDLSTRPHVVTRRTNNLFYTLIEYYRQITGIPLLLNTSLNTAGLPICHTPQDAIQLYLHNSLVDVLAIGGIYLKKGDYR